ncbi:MAG: 50S ribosomal protein L10 [Marinilabiliaceae bacterium]|nr:50S ribosomal protein L10 [Marinilabiliaceae bacterium]
MRKIDKTEIINEIAAKISEFGHFYVTDTTGLKAGATNNLRRLCFKSGVKMVVVKNTLFQKAIEQSGKKIEGLEEALKGTSAILFTNTNSLPAKLIKDFRKKASLPVFKGAYVEESVYIGESQLEALATIKSKEELIGDLIALLQSPIRNVLGALQSGGNTIHGILKTLGEKE